jgi:hypothetical protein
VLLELTVAEQRFNAVMEVLRDGLTAVEVAERYGVSRQTRPSMAGWAAIGPAGWRPWPTGPTAPIPVRISCRPRSRPACASCAGAIPAGVSAASPTSWSGSASTHRLG